MKIRTWLTAANICLIAIFVSIGFLVYETRKIDHQLKEVHTDSISKIILIQELEDSTKNLASFALEYLLTQDKNAKENYDKLLDIRHGNAVRPYTSLVASNEAISLHALLEKHHISGENRAILEELLKEIQQLEASNIRAFQKTKSTEQTNNNNNTQTHSQSNTINHSNSSAYDFNSYNQTNALSITQSTSENKIQREEPFIYEALYQTALMEIHRKVNKLIAYIHENTRVTSIPLNVILKSYSLYIEILLAVGIVILFLITILCYTNIIARINKASAFIAHMRLARMSKPIKVGTKDEISILNCMLNTLATKYQILIETKEAYEQVQNLSRQTQPSIQELSYLSKDIEQNLASSAQNSTEQANNITELVDSVREMNSSVAEVAKNAGSAADIAGQTKTKAEDGEKFVQNLIASIETVHDNSSSLKEDMTTLLHHTKQVNEIMGVITDIADQTNLLALNAAIEAARAGDAGRGFAVVADEVRKLAEKTMLSTTGVGNAIESIQKSVQNSTEQVDVTVENINSVTTIASECGIALQEIVFMAENSADQIRIIAIAAEEQSSSTDAITSTISNISIAAEEQKVLIDNTVNSLKNLETSQEKLTNCVDFIALSNVQSQKANEEEEN